MTSDTKEHGEARYSCYVEGCPADHLSKYAACIEPHQLLRQRPTPERIEALPSRTPNKVADLLTLWSKEYLDDRGMVFASSLCDDAAAYLRHYAALESAASATSGRAVSVAKGKP